MMSVEMVRMKESCPSTTSGSPGRSRSRSRLQPVLEAVRHAREEGEDRDAEHHAGDDERPEHHHGEQGSCRETRARSSTQAFTVPKATASTATGTATLRLLPMLLSQIGIPAARRACRSTAPVPMNHSSVKPCQGGDGNWLALKAKTATTSERREQKDVERRDVELPGEGRAVHGDHACCKVVPRLWPVRRRPAQTMAEESSSSSMPKAAPWGQLKRVMNCA